MHVALPADGARVPEACGHHVDGLHDPLIRGALVPSGSEHREGARREDGARPGAEVFRRHVLVRYLAQILIHVIRSDRS